MKPQEKLDYALHWVWSCKLQIDRLTESTLKEWNSNEKETVAKRKVFSRTSYDEHMLLIAARNLVRATNLTVTDFPQLNSLIAHSEAIRLLRNIYDHWDGVISGKPSTSAQEFAQKFPQGKPFSITYTSQGPVIGGVLPLHDFLNQLSELEKHLLSLEKAAQSQP